MASSFISNLYSVTAWLYVKIYENPFFFFDYWSIMHIITSSLVIIILNIFNLKHKFIILFLSVVSWEIFELLFLYFNFNIFQPETLKDQATDIAIGMFSGLLTQYFIINKNKIYILKNIKQQDITILLTAFLISFNWVGFYNYHYSVKELNFNGLNLWAFSLWSVGNIAILKGYLFLRRFFKNTFLLMPIFGIIYFLILLIVEYIGRYLLEIKEVSSPNHTPLIFGLIYGNNVLHLMYIVMPFVSFTIFKIIDYSLNKVKLKNQINKSTTTNLIKTKSA